jgi:aminomethyltransferase
MDQGTPLLRKTPLHARHRASGARMVPFGGWEMPVEYSGISTEHMAVRERAGLFDVSHMGEIEVAGSDALRALQRISCNDVNRLDVGQAQYSGLLTPQGTFVDDILVYRLASAHFLLVVNATRIEADYLHIVSHASSMGDVVAFDASSRYALIAIQGPASPEILQTLTAVDLSALRYYRFAHGEVAGARATISRTGYTGELGFEIFVPPQAADKVWLALLDAGRGRGLVECGLGARDTLRLEAAMRLYGSDIDDTTTPLEAGLEWIVGWEKQDYVGADALTRQRTEGVSRHLVGFEMLDRAIARHGHGAFAGAEQVGTVTSGTQTPYLKKAIGMGYLRSDCAVEGFEFDVDVRGRRARAKVVPLPFYKRAPLNHAAPVTGRAGS